MNDQVKTVSQGPKIGFISGGKQPEDGGQSILDRFNPYVVFGGSPEEAEEWRAENQAMAHITADGEPGTTALAFFARKNVEHEHLDDWACYALVPYRPAVESVPGFIAIPIGHGTTDPLTMIVRLQHLGGTMVKSCFSTALLDVFHDAAGKPVAAVALGNAFGPSKEDESDEEEEEESDESKPAVIHPYVPYSMYYPVGVTAEGVKLLVPPGRQDQLTYEEAKQAAEEFFLKVTQV